ncbi:hypothetical protein [Candidatus Xenohaliotis californiensis]
MIKYKYIASIFLAFTYILISKNLHATPIGLCNSNDNFYTTKELDNSSFDEIKKFPLTTTNDSAQQNFLSGLLALHYFEPIQANFYFQNAHNLDKNMIMALWGQILAYRQLGSHTQQKINQIIDQINSYSKEKLSELSESELHYINAVKNLYQKKENETRAKLKIINAKYLNAMQSIKNTYSDNLNAVLLYLQSVLTSPIYSNNPYNIKKYGEILENEYKKHPQINLFKGYAATVWNTPTLAYKANKILTSMKDHVNIGPCYTMLIAEHYFNTASWTEFIQLNKISWDLSKKIIAKNNLDKANLNYQAAINIIYGLTQLMSLDEALVQLKEIKETIDTNNNQSIQAMYRAIVSFINNTNAQHSEALSLITNLQDELYNSNAIENVLIATVSISQSNEIENALKILNKQLVKLNGYDQDIGYIIKNQLLAKLNVKHKDYQRAIHFAQNAIMIEKQISPTVSTKVFLKPSQELLAEILLQEDLAGEAYKMFLSNNLYAPGRPISIIGANIAANAINDKRLIAIMQYYISNFLPKNALEKTDLYISFEHKKQHIE